METTSRSSRRAFVLGGAAVAACTGPLAVAQLARGASPSLKGAAKPTIRSEIAEWGSLVGTSFLIGGESGKALAKLAAIEQPAFDPTRPGTLARSQPFTAWFEMDARLAPAGQRGYTLTHPVKGAIKLFLSRGVDKRGKATLLALFN